MCTDLSYRGHIVCCIQSEQVQRIDGCRFEIGGVIVDFWDAMHVTVIGNRSVIEILSEGTRDLTAKANRIQDQIELLQNQLRQLKSKGDSNAWFQR